MDQRLQDIKTYFRNVTLNSTGAAAELYSRLAEGDVPRALSMLQDRADEVDQAIKEYNTETHKVMHRPNKARRNQPDYRTEKLPRNRPRYINEVELFFLLGRPIAWDRGQADEQAFALLTDFLKESHFDARMRRAKRLAGAETESAKLYRVYRSGSEPRCDIVVLARSTGYSLRPLFDQYGNMLAFACGYKLNEAGGKPVQHWDFYTPEAVVEARLGTGGWETSYLPNPLGKIPVVYYRQPKAWEGAQRRIEREEFLDSKTADTNNYFADPIAKATADVVESLADPLDTGKLIQIRGAGSSFEYVNPPQSSQTREGEKKDLDRSILFDTMTPDLSFENLRGFGSVSGAAIRNAMSLGYIKRDNRIEIYGEMVERELSLIVEYLCLASPAMAPKLREMRKKVTFRFSEPFAADNRDEKSLVAQLYAAGLLSLETAVGKVGMADSAPEEAARIREGLELAAMAAQAQAQMQAGQPQGQGGGENPAQGPQAEGGEE